MTLSANSPQPTPIERHPFAGSDALQALYEVVTEEHHGEHADCRTCAAVRKVQEAFTQLGEPL